jgi:hypothetical protein
MGKMQRNKGAGFEREISKHLREWLTAAIGALPKGTAERKLSQARDAGNDLDVGLIDAPLLIIECKRRKTLGTVYQWLLQAEAAIYARFGKSSNAGSAPHPIVVGREDGGAPIVILHLDDFLALSRREVVAHFLQEVLGEDADD